MEKILSLVPLEAPLRGFRLGGELDFSSAPDLNDALSTVAREGDLTLELSELEFIDSSGLHALMHYAGSLNGNGDGNLVLANPSTLAARVFEIVGLTGHPRIVIEVTNGE